MSEGSKAKRGEKQIDAVEVIKSGGMSAIVEASGSEVDFAKSEGVYTAENEEDEDLAVERPTVSPAAAGAGGSSSSGLQYLHIGNSLGRRVRTKFCRFRRMT